MEKGVETNDWLGGILKRSNSTFLDYSKLDFCDFINKLLSEIGTMGLSDMGSDSMITEIKEDSRVNESLVKLENLTDFSVLNSEDIENSKREIRNPIDWDNADAEKWFKENNIKISIYNALITCDGFVLYHLYMMLIKDKKTFINFLMDKQIDLPPNDRFNPDDISNFRDNLLKLQF